MPYWPISIIPDNYNVTTKLIVSVRSSTSSSSTINLYFNGEEESTKINCPILKVEILAFVEFYAGLYLVSVGKIFVNVCAKMLITRLWICDATLVVMAKYGTKLHLLLW